ncbi:MAG: hypothetical protein MJ191_07520 [Clostridium sp.]|nr:hypothetical protein [Clostridium sp.]
MAGQIKTETTETKAEEKKETQKPLFSCGDKSVNFNLGTEISTWVPNSGDLTMDHVVTLTVKLIDLKIALLNSKK